jgi:hypothetical protein
VKKGATTLLLFLNTEAPTMRLIDKILERFGYVKAQARIPQTENEFGPSKPSSYPETDAIPPQSSERDIIMEPKNETTEDPNAPLTPAPEQWSGNPNTPMVQLKPHGNEPARLNRPFDPDKEQLSPGQPSELAGPNEMNRKDVFDADIFDTEDVNEVHPALAQRMARVGIKFVNRKMFMERYNEAVKDAMRKKIPLSEYFANGRPK